jgi:hypothetical protein
MGDFAKGAKDDYRNSALVERVEFFPAQMGKVRSETGIVFEAIVPEHAKVYGVGIGGAMIVSDPDEIAIYREMVTK